MSSRKISKAFLKQSNVVGAIHTLRGLQAALELKPDSVDFLEIRLDHFLKHEDQVLLLLPHLKIPLIITVRHHLEGGAHPIPVSRKRELFTKFMPYATMIDIELRTTLQLAAIIKNAREQGVRIIISSHHFRATPSHEHLRSLADQARKLKGDIFKVATLTSTLNDLQKLLSLLEQEKRIPLSIMGMGRFGKVSRLLFAQAGSVLNYGFLDEAQVQGQWRADVLRQWIAELT